MTTRHRISRPASDTAAAVAAGRFRNSALGALAVAALLAALPALAAPAAGDRDKAQQIQDRQTSRGSQVQVSKPSPPPQTASPPPTISSPPPQTSSPPPSTSSPPPSTASSAPRQSSPPPQGGSVGRGDTRREPPVRTHDSDGGSARRTPWNDSTDWVNRNASDGRETHGGGGSSRDHGRTNRNHHSRDHRGYHRHNAYCGHHWGGYPYYPHHRPWYPWWPWWPTIYVESDTRRADDGWGALDLDVRPERAEIFLDGQYVGIADEYDGFPSYLWLQEGTYDLAIYLEGYETIFRQVSIYPGIVIDIENSMRNGKAIHPDEYGPSSTERRDARIERNREKEEYAREMEERQRSRETWSSDDPVSGAGASIGRLYVSVLPPDAAVYLDGHFFGTAGEIGQLSAGLVVEPGDHVIELVRPGYETHREEIVVPPGERVTLEVELERD